MITINELETINHAYNNAVVTFNSDNVLTPKHCVIDVNGESLKITPNPDGNFRYNFKSIQNILLNQNRFTDDLSPDIQPADDSTLTYDGTASTFLELNVTYTITFSDDSTEQLQKSYNVLRSVEQAEDFIRQQFQSDNNLYLLSPFKDDSALTYYAKYFEGYPFDLSLLSLDNGESLKVTNQTVSIDYPFPIDDTKVIRFVLSDGRTDASVEQYIPLVDGFNSLVLDNNGNLISIDLEKQDAGCGVYIKWLNNYGGWSYWLFNDRHNRERDLNRLDEVNNDYNNLKDTTDPYYNLGITSRDELDLVTDDLNDKQKLLLDTIYDSPSVYLFTGKPFAQATAKNWLRVNVTNSVANIRDYRDNKYNVELTVELPKRNTMTL